MKVLIVGLGSIGRKHINSLMNLPEIFTVYALRSNKNAQPEEGISNIFDLSEVSDIDFAIVSTPTFLHKESIKQLLFLRCPLFIEKPLFHNLDIKEEAELVEHSTILNYVACNLRFLNCLQFIKSELEKGLHRINEINVYCGSYLPEWRPNQDFRKVYSSNSEMGGGVHLDLIHEFDYIYWFFGKPINVSKITSNKSTLQINAPDYANYCLEYKTFCVSVILNYFRRDVKRSLEIVFDDFTWNVDLVNNKIFRDNTVIFESSQRVKDTYESQMQYFIELVKHKEKFSLNNVADAYNVLKICLGVC